MRKLFFLAIMCVFSFALAAQGNSNKDKTKEKNNPSSAIQHGNKEKVKYNDKTKDNDKDDKVKSNEKGNKELEDHNKKIWEGTSDKSGGPQASKNQPAKVREAFQHDYPNATNVYWSKYRGDWTATFGNGIWRSTAIYHANGQRKDTRTPISRNEIPRKVLDSASKRQPNDKIEEAVRIQVPSILKDVIRIKRITPTNVSFDYYDADGKLIKYDY